MSSANSAAKIQNYIRTAAARGRETERIGPFLATFSPHTTNPYLNYAIPDAGAEPTAADADALAAAFERRGRQPRLEFLPAPAPAVEKALAASGYVVDLRVPLMDCPPGAVVEHPVPAGFELVTPETDDEILAMIRVRNAAFGNTEEVTVAEADRYREARESGVRTLLARDLATGEVAGAGLHDAIVDGITELAGFGVAERYRRRGLAVALTAHLTKLAHASGAATVFLTPGGDEAERVYARAGYRRQDEVVFMSR